MDVSVIFATYNRGDILESVFEKWREVQQVTAYDFEIICSDDASTDNTIEIIKNVKDLPIVLLQNEKGGAGKARNAALKVATGKLVIFTGDDMFPEPEFINRHFENYKKYGEKVATLGRIEWYPDLDLNYLMHHITNVGCEQFGFIGLPPYQLIDFRHFYTSNISVPISLLKAQDEFFSSGFDKYGFEDIELGYRLEKAGMKIYYDPDIVVTHHHIYNSVEKFCNRQMCAGEELVVFQQMHKDLEDKCILDVENCKYAFQKYINGHGGKHSVKGAFIWWVLVTAKNSTHILEKLIAKSGSDSLKRLASLIYAGIFQFYFNYGCTMRIASNNNISNSKLVYFTYKYMKSGYAQLYWDIGYGYNEAESRKWVCWDESEYLIEKELPLNVKELRFSPLKKKCQATIKDIYFITDENKKENAEIYWHNSRNGRWEDGDYSHTDDPMIIIQKIQKNYRKIVIKIQVKDMKKSVISIIMNAARRFYSHQKVKVSNNKEWNVQFTSGQARKIQIGIGGINDQSRKKIIEEYQRQVGILGDAILISDVKAMQRGYVNYLYMPKREPLDTAQMMQVVYTLLNTPYDYIVASKSYEEYPQIACKCLDDVLIYSSIFQGKSQEKVFKNGIGRYMRLPSFEVENSTIDLLSKYTGIALKNEFILQWESKSNPIFRISPREYTYQKKKKLVFVFPIFLAVGGVERNTIEVMRSLKDKYEFCMVTMERHSKTQGSLHYQLKGICDYIFDLREITEFENYLNCLYELNAAFHPDIIWLCNNSPWFEEHTLQIREVFGNVPIVAQDVYDTKVGWIEYYNTPGVKTFDRYIAISELIKDTFIEKYEIAEKKIDVIYPVVDQTKVCKALNSNATYEELCLKYDLDKEKEHYSFIARLTEQKNPIRYLKLVQAVMKECEREIQFIMVGDGVLSSEVNEYIERHNMQELVKRIEYIADVPEFVGILDGLILTSVYEGMPIVSIEAMSMSAPILSTDIGDLKRFLKKTEGGIIIDESKSDYENFMYFRSNLSKYKQNAHKHANEMLEFFSAGTLAKKYIQAFEKAMGN